MHHDPSGPGLALEKSTTPLKSGSSGSWMGENGTSGSGPAAGMGWGCGLTRVTRDNIPNWNNLVINKLLSSLKKESWWHPKKLMIHFLLSWIVMNDTNTSEVYCSFWLMSATKEASSSWPNQWRAEYSISIQLIHNLALSICTVSSW